MSKFIFQGRVPMKFNGDRCAEDCLCLCSKEEWWCHLFETDLSEDKNMRYVGTYEEPPYRCQECIDLEGELCKKEGGMSEQELDEHVQEMRNR